jgi:hypothetical protein
MLKFLTKLIKKPHHRLSANDSDKAQPAGTEAISTEASFQPTESFSPAWLGASISGIYLDSDAINNIFTKYSAAINYPGHSYDETIGVSVRNNPYYLNASALFRMEEYSSKIFDYRSLVIGKNEGSFPAMSDQVEHERALKEEEKQGFLKRLLLLFETTDFEYGIRNEADIFVENFISLNPTQTKEWLEDFFVKYFSKAAILTKLLRTIARIDYQDICPQGTLIATAALKHEDIEVRECGIRAFESWGSLESLEVLGHLRVSEKWLQDYVDEVVRYLRKDFDVAVRQED